MQDLMQSYANDLNKLRDAFHNELTATAEELSKAMAFYASRSDAALASLMEKATAREMEETLHDHSTAPPGGPCQRLR